MFGALSNPSRLRIVNLLIESPQCVKDLADVLHLSQSNVSQHLGVLYAAGLVSCQRKGGSSSYSLTIPELYQQLIHCLSSSRAIFPLLQQDLAELERMAPETKQAP
jgi:DNA-binding transcriptional ArsR family regulator